MVSAVHQRPTGAELARLAAPESIVVDLVACPLACEKHRSPLLPVVPPPEGKGFLSTPSTMPKVVRSAVAVGNPVQETEQKGERDADKLDAHSSGIACQHRVENSAPGADALSDRSGHDSRRCQIRLQGGIPGCCAADRRQGHGEWG